MPFPPDFEQEALYERDSWFIHDLLVLDPEAHRVVGLVDTTRLGPLVDAQRPVGGHEKHLPGAVAVQITGTLGQLHAIYVMGLRASEGWVGFGTHLRDARFRRLGKIGPPIHAELVATRQRQVRGTWFVDYRFLYTQEGAEVYSSTQTAAWVKTG